MVLLGTLYVLDTVDPVTNDLASARQKKSLVTESRWSQEPVFVVKFAGAVAMFNVRLMTATFTNH